MLQRLREFVVKLGVELVFIDEVQTLIGKTTNKVDITDELRGFLNDGIVPLVLLGDERSEPFFKENEKLAARLGPPLVMRPLIGKVPADAAIIKKFCADLDAALVAAGCTARASGFADSKILNGLLKASGGYLGRICRIVEAALEHAILRDAKCVETYDLWNAVETFAKPMRYVRSNPFDLKPGPVRRATRQGV